MKWQNLKIGFKIGLGFAIMMIIAIIIGSASFYTLNRIGTESSRLSNEFIPLIGNSSQVSENWTEISDLLQIYDISGDAYFIRRARARLTNCKSALDRLVEISSGKGNAGSGKNDFDKIRQEVIDFGSTLEAYDKIASGANLDLNRMENYIDKIRGSLNNQVSKNSDWNHIYYIITDLYSRFEEATRNEHPALLADAAMDADQLLRTWSQVKRNILIPDTLVTGFANSAIHFISIFPEAKKMEIVRREKTKAISWDIKGITDIGLDGASSFGKETTTVIQSTRRVLLISTLVLLILGAVLIYYITTSITRPIQESIDAANLLAEGDLSRKIETDRKDEVGILANALNSVRDNLKTIIVKLSDNSHIINQSSENLLSSATEISDGARQQAAAAEEMAASMEQMHANIQQNSENAQETERMARESAVKINRSKESFQLATDSLKNIATEITIIKDISFQTNILALNAAIEAARAGDYGRGFAVVAGEVKRLAEKSNQASVRITDVSGSTLSISGTAKSELTELVPEIEKTAKLIQEIAAASLEQTSSVDHINNAMQQLNDVVQSNAQRADELTTHSQQLAEQAQELQRIIASFKS